MFATSPGLPAQRTVIKMAEGKASKKSNRILTIAICIAVLTVAVYVGYLNIPRHVSRLYPEIRQAELCEVLYVDKDMESTTASFEGEGLEGLIEKLDGLSLYPLLGGHGRGGSVVLEGDAEWHFYFRINGQTAEQSVTVTNHGQVSVGNRIFEVREADILSLMESILTE